MHVSALHYDRQWDVGTLPPFSRNGLLVEWVGKNKSVLEMGCATGFLSRHFAANGCSVTGLEYDPRAAQIASQHCARVIVSDLNRDWRKDLTERFDVVTFGDVLEHLLDPVSVLSQCRDLLAANGRVIISLPNVAFLSNRLNLLLGRWDYTETGLLDHTHLKFFTLKSALDMIEKAGFVVDSFFPVTGLRGMRKLPSLVNGVTRMLPGIFGFQLIFALSSRGSYA